MKTSDVVREIRKLAKSKYGVRITNAQVKVVLDCLKDVTYEQCKHGGSVKLRGFMTIKGVLTRSRKMPDGRYNIPRWKIKVILSDVMVEQFKDDVTGKLED